jgi:hypothetical protein
MAVGAGPLGPFNSTWRGGTGVPAGDVGYEGDYYIDTANTSVYYGPKFAGSWGVSHPLGGATTSADWVFDVTTYGAKGNGVEVQDGAMGIGSSTLTCSTSLPFGAAKPGMPVQVKGAGLTGETSLVGVINTVTDSGHVVLSVSNASGSSLTGLQVQFGTDDTQAFNDAVTAATAYARSHGGLAKVYIPASAGQFYCIAGALITGGATLGNAQIPLPVIPTTENKVTLIFEGPGNASAFQHWQQTAMQKSGATLVSFGVFASQAAQFANIDANGDPSVIGGPTTVNGYGRAALFNNVYVVLSNLAIRTSHSSHGWSYGEANFYGCAEASLQNFTWGTNGNVVAGDYSNQNLLADGVSKGVMMPASGNNDNCWTSNVSCQGGHTYAIFATEHFVGDRVALLYCWTAWAIIGVFDGSVGASHAINVGQTSVESCTNVIQVFGEGQQGIGPWLYGTFDTEGTITLTDNNSGAGLAALLGEINLVGLVSVDTITVTNPTGLKIVNGQQGFVSNVHSANYTVTVLDDTVLVDATAGPVTITLISAAWTPNVYTVKKIDASANAVTVAAQAGETIDGAATASLPAQWSSVNLFPARVSTVWSWYKR